MEQFLLNNLGTIITILSMLCGGVALAASIRSKVENQSDRLEGIETELSELRKVVITLARQEERLMALDQRMLAQGQRIDAQAARITTLDQRINNNLILIKQSRDTEISE